MIRLLEHFSSIIMLHQSIAYNPPAFQHVRYPNAVRRCRDAYEGMDRIMRRLNFRDINQQHPLLGYCVFVLGRGICIHLRSEIDPLGRKIAASNAALGHQVALCIEVLDALGQVWACAGESRCQEAGRGAKLSKVLSIPGLFAKTLRRGFAAVHNLDLEQAFFVPKAVPMSVTKNTVP